MFQPAEETFEGADNMIEHGILENQSRMPALAFHVTTGRSPVGTFMYNSKNTMMNSVDGFQITIHGKGSHGAARIRALTRLTLVSTFILPCKN